MNQVAGNRTNIAPKSIPWAILRTLITEMYGGKVDSAHDFSILSNLVTSILTPSAFEESHALVPASEAQDALIVPQGTAKRDFSNWVNGLPEREPPTYLGLEGDAEKLLLVAHAEEMCRNLRRVLVVLDEGEAVMAEAVEVGRE